MRLMLSTEKRCLRLALVLTDVSPLLSEISQGLLANPRWFTRMFADAVENPMTHVSGNSALDPASSFAQKSEENSLDDAQDSGELLAAALEGVKGVHLLPCHIKYSGLASVSENFQPRRVKPAAAAASAAADAAAAADGQLEVLLHGRWLRGKEEPLAKSSCSAAEAPQLQGFLVAAQEASCSQQDVRRSLLLSAAAAAASAEEDSLVEAEEPPMRVTSLRPLAAFDKITYWQQDREPSSSDDVPKSLFFLRATAALHDFKDELGD
ncbi:hypothetical protein, conserved [Eimeria tenella]|uniref:Uncharacterized protein n=1 Tax=Eimeria tenella TaxID=5802 RepID=U6L369_EIMTE|nr:hypothetical protein, conserved [Eimeria tenella]CDJ43044.1 hypothetical protein, conserved [Eimeria tenella]|eukprot:XP_013233794.1 hypothetical protein, conserved [Eimeria tenella]